MSRPQPDETVTTADPEQLLAGIRSELETSRIFVGGRGSVTAAECLAMSTHRLVVLVGQLDGYAAARAEMLRSTAEIAMSHGDADPDPYGLAMAGLDEAPPRRGFLRRLADWLKGGGRRDA